MNLDREKFLSAVIALALGGAVTGCGSEPPPAAEEPAPEATAGAELPPEPAPPPVEEPPPAATPAPEPVPEVQPTGPTTE